MSAATLASLESGTAARAICLGSEIQLGEMRVRAARDAVTTDGGIVHESCGRGTDALCGEFEGIASLPSPSRATPNYVVMSLHIFVIHYSSVMNGIRRNPHSIVGDRLPSESLVALGNNGNQEESMRTTKTESVGRGLEPAVDDGVVAHLGGSVPACSAIMYRRTSRASSRRAVRCASRARRGRPPHAETRSPGRLRS